MRRLVDAALHDREKLKHLRPWRRHSLVLTVGGAIYILIGLSYIVSSGTGERAKSLSVALQIMPMWGWGILFISAGALAVISARWPQASDTWGYSVMSGLSALWSSWYVWGVFYGAPAATISGALVWGAIAFLWWAVSGLVNPITSDHEHELGPKPW